MRITPSDIEDIVQVVLHRLKSMSARPSPGSSATQDKPQPPQTAASAGVLQLDQRLITLRDVEQRWDAVNELRVPAGAVITPAVQDELRAREIRIVRGLVSVASQTTAPIDNVSSMLIMVEATRRSALSWPGTLATASFNPMADLGRIAAHLNGGGQAAIWCSARPFAAAASVHGHRRIRAIQLPDSGELERAVRESDPNLIIVDDHHYTGQQVVDLARRWLSRVDVKPQLETRS